MIPILVYHWRLLVCVIFDEVSEILNTCIICTLVLEINK